MGKRKLVKVDGITFIPIVIAIDENGADCLMVYVEHGVKAPRCFFPLLADYDFAAALLAGETIVDIQDRACVNVDWYIKEKKFKTLSNNLKKKKKVWINEALNEE